MRAFLRGKESESGQAIVLFAVTLMGMLLTVGLAVDAGQLYSARRTMQEAADAGAYAGAVVLYQGGTVLQATTAARDDVSRNGYVQGGDGGVTNVVVNSPPTSGPNSGSVLHVEVIITTDVQVAILSQSPLSDVRVRAVAGADPTNNNFAIMALDTGNTPGAFNISPNGDVHLTGGGILVNSSSATAAGNSQNNGCRLTISPSPNGVSIVGGTGSTWPTSGCASPASPAFTVSTAQPQQADPFAGFPKPSISGMTTYNAIPNDKILNPGVWITSLTAAGNNTLYLRPGIYILKAGINAAGNADVISTNAGTTPSCSSNCGVFIFNTHSNYPNPYIPGTSTCGALSLVGNAASNLKAQTTGTYANFLVYQDANCTNELTISGNGTFTGTGTIYLPNANFRFNGNNATLMGSQLVARTVDIQNGNITIDFTSATTAQPILPRLTE